MRDDQKLVPIAEFEGSFDAELAKLALENAGIESVVFGEDLLADPDENINIADLPLMEETAATLRAQLLDHIATRK